jgi:predicted RND superfamily exporter protein
MPGHEKRTLRFARFVVRRRAPIGTLLIGLTLFFLYPTVNAGVASLGVSWPGPRVRVDSKARDMFPDHPFIHAQDKFAGHFGNSTLVAVALVVEDGTIWSVETLRKLKRITRALDGDGYDSRSEERSALQSALEDAAALSREEIKAEIDRRYPPYPVNHYFVRSLTHESTRIYEMDPGGGITGDYLIEDLPETQAEVDEVRRKVRELIPHIYGSLVSHDEKAALVTAAFVTDRLASREVFKAVFDHVRSIQEREQAEGQSIHVSGLPILTGWILADAWQIALFVALAVATIFGLLWLYFRRGHGVVIPMICAAVTVIWGLGFTGWAGIAFDPLILVIPMVITARAVSHTVQMAERFFEDYETLHAQLGDPERAKLEAATVAMGELVIPGTLGIVTDVAGLLVILVTTIPQMWNLGLFGAFWVAAIVATVELLHPILICYLPPPHEPRHYVPHFMLRMATRLGNATTHRVGKWVIAGATLALFTGSAWVTFHYAEIGEARPGTPLFWPDHPFNVASRAITERFGGADTFTIYADGDRDNASTDGETLWQMIRLQRTLELESGARATLSLAPLVAGVNRQLKYGDPKFESVPEGSLVRGLIFRIRSNSPPGALAQMLTHDGRASTLTAFYPDHRGETIRKAVATAERFIHENPMGEISVRLARNHSADGAPPWDGERLKDLLYYMIGPLLPARAHTLDVRARGTDGYKPLRVQRVESDGLPEWIEGFRDAAIVRYAAERDSLRSNQVFTWPARLAAWGPESVDEWWEDREAGVRAVAVHTQDLIVQDLKARDPLPEYQPTGSWTRGVQFVMAGGLMGILAAVNEEVERSHLANITLILFVIFVLHSLTYWSIPSGGILLLQLATATLLSLAYMALKGVGLNINTLPVQAVGVGIGVDYAIYIVDRIRQEVAATGGDIDEAIRRAIRTTGMAVSFTATTVVGGILFWVFSSLRFQAEMAQLLIILMVINMIGALTVVPALYAIVRPRVASRLLVRDARPTGAADAGPG